MQKPLIALGILLIAGSVAGWYLLRKPPENVAAPDSASAAADQPAGSTSAIITRSVEEIPASTEPLPALADSDAPLVSALSEVAGATTVNALVRPENLIRRIVVTIDNLPRQKLSAEQRPLQLPAGRFNIDGEELSGIISSANYYRYDTAVDALKALNMQKLAVLYKRFYPLFQQAYQDLGFPNGHFNDRLIGVVDHLLATPSPPEPIKLQRPNVFYEFADPRLEALSAGQKQLIRIGPENRAVVKSRLADLKAELAR